MIADGAPSPHDAIYWEQGNQTAMRQGDWKLVLNGQLVEGAPPEDEVHLADLRADMGERKNLREECPEIAARMGAAAKEWRAGIDKEWEAREEEAAKNLTGH